jgi:hypothetical protein
MAGKKEWERFNFPSEDDWNKLNKQPENILKIMVLYGKT